jgi:threonine/homoserine/homoserine lactone efflux protein
MGLSAAARVIALERNRVNGYIPSMTFWMHFFQGAVIGISVAAPIGPMALLCISRTAISGRLAGFVSGLAAASGDLFYASVGAFGIRTVSSLLVTQQFWLRLFGGCYLIYLAAITFNAVPKQLEKVHPNREGLLRIYGSTFLLNLSNPMTFLPFVAFFAGAGLSLGNDSRGAIAMVTGVFLGACSWWLFLSAFCDAFRSHLGPERLRAINRISAIAIGCFALYSIHGVITK